MTDEAILKLFESRSEDALKAVSDAYRGLIFSVAFGILRSREDAEECVNDVLLSAWDSIPPLPESLPAYLSKLARNAAISAYRIKNAQKRGGGQVPAIIDELSECIPDPASGRDPCDDMVLRGVLSRFVSSLPGEMRGMFVKRYWYSYSLAEVAQAFGVSESRVKARLARARKKLRKMLEKEGVPV